MIDGVLLTPLMRVFHPSGDILHGMKASSPGFAGFGEAYFSSIKKDFIKGWKRHNRMTLNLVVPVGSIRFAICDDRGAKNNKPDFFDVVINKDNYSRLTIPPGVWVCFKGIEESNLLLNIIAEEHDMAESDNKPFEDIKFSFS
jgi:dTDP-4-dehydrorhamnose 3,5-epimerase